MKIVVNDLAKIHEQARIDGVGLITVEITNDATGYLRRLCLVLAPSVPPFLEKPFVVIAEVDKGSGRSGSELNFDLTFKDLTRLSSALTEVLRKLHGDGDR